MQYARWGLWVFIFFCLLATALWQPKLIRFWPFSAAEFAQLIAPLFLVALFIERTMEVFLTVWRGPGSAKCGREISTLKAAKAPVKDIEGARDKLSGYKSQTQRIAFLSSLTLGIVVSALGIRALEMFIDPTAFKGPDGVTTTQVRLFNSMDVVLTGALLGGGSDALHKLITVFTNFMETSSKKAKGEEG